MKSPRCRVNRLCTVYHRFQPSHFGRKPPVFRLNISNLPFLLNILPVSSLTLPFFVSPVFLARFFAVSLRFFSNFYPHGIRAWACDNFGCGNYTLDCLNFMQGLHSFVVSKCRKRDLRGTNLKFFALKPWNPTRSLQLQRSWEQLCHS